MTLECHQSLGDILLLMPKPAHLLRALAYHPNALIAFPNHGASLRTQGPGAKEEGILPPHFAQNGVRLPANPLGGKLLHHGELHRPIRQRVAATARVPEHALERRAGGW